MLCCERGGTNSIYETPLSTSQHLLQPTISFADLVSSEIKNAVESGYPGGR